MHQLIPGYMWVIENRLLTGIKHLLLTIKSKIPLGWLAGTVLGWYIVPSCVQTVKHTWRQPQWCMCFECQWQYFLNQWFGWGNECALVQSKIFSCKTKIIYNWRAQRRKVGKLFNSLFSRQHFNLPDPSQPLFFALQ